jgi:hypothetical protein
MLVLCIRGLLSVLVGSTAMEDIAASINKVYPGAAQVTDHGANYLGPIGWFNNVGNMAAQCTEAHGKGEKIVLIGHSFGATAALMVTRILYKSHIDVDFLGPIDPAAQYDTSVSSNVGGGLSYYQLTLGQLGQGIVVPDNTWAPGKFKETISVTERPGETHLQIAADPYVQKAMFNATQKVLNGHY